MERNARRSRRVSSEVWIKLSPMAILPNQAKRVFLTPRRIPTEMVAQQTVAQMHRSSSAYTEDALVEQPTIALFAELGWATAVCLFEQADHCPFTGRETTAEVVLTARLRPALQKLNPGLPSEAYDQAIEQLTRSRSIMSMAQANHEVYGLLKEGVRVFIQDENGEEQVTTLRVIDWQCSREQRLLSSLTALGIRRPLQASR